jgi:hypothetical protein
MQQAEKLITYLNDASDLLTERLDELMYMVSHCLALGLRFGDSTYVSEVCRR